ncbi:MAG: YraN family protein [Spirochaetia bacterium]|nr:YraN family protein [Spirochaetia bacterium]MCF7946530.1 YraN family protein [Spirochaetia bacterium]
MYINKTSKEIGFEGEEKARDYLKNLGYCILEKNYYSKQGELDIIASDDNTLIGFEVKNWSYYSEEELYRVITPLKKKRMMQTMMNFLAVTEKAAYSYIRFDVIFINGSSIIHYKDIT